MKALRIIKGDATSPHAKGRKVIGHVCNDVGGWGIGCGLAGGSWDRVEPLITRALCARDIPVTVYHHG